MNESVSLKRIERKCLSPEPLLSFFRAFLIRRHRHHSRLSITWHWSQNRRRRRRRRRISGTKLCCFHRFYRTEVEVADKSFRNRFQEKTKQIGLVNWLPQKFSSRYRFQSLPVTFYGLSNKSKTKTNRTFFTWHNQSAASAQLLKNAN